ncbi:TlpA family protein disulfide reductase [Segetibacter aerophilus]|uniref:Thioredoxin domain-containing protein n=1 Tax=Segetibacter aerophilus TaxID=670293 RepID=A0A512BGJ6_9BACT|nr:TlpA disulfide reductase family protein [Segetibacter aerophilus]GEO11090.1 hypothetical protein SAE01_35860 [Segetibacter aerophilus]
MKRFKTILLFILLSPLFSLGQVLDKEDVDEYLQQLKFLNGKLAPNFALPDTAENVFNLKSVNNKVVILDFWFTTCAPCINEIPAFKNLYSAYKPSGNVVFVSVCIDNIANKPRWKNMISKYKLPGIQLFMAKDKALKSGNNFYKQKINTFPTRLLVSKTGTILGVLPDIENYLVLYSIDGGVKGRSTAASFMDAIESKERVVTWANLNKNKIMRFQKTK